MALKLSPGEASPPIAQTIRLVLVPLLLAGALFPDLYQPLLDSLWYRLLASRVYQWSTFETLWTVLLYAVIETSITAVFVRKPKWRFTSPGSTADVDEAAAPTVAGLAKAGRQRRSRPSGMRRPSRRIGEILVYVMPLLLMDLVMIKKFSGVKLDDMLRTGGYHVDNMSHSWSNDTLWAPRQTFLVPTLHNFTLNSPLQTTRALPPSPPTSRRLLSELAASFLIYDFVFFLFHLALHVIPPLRRMHAPHHSHDAQLNPQVTNQLSVGERLGLVLLANFSLNVIGAHVLTRTLFVPVFVWLLVEIHCGMDVPWGYDKVLPRGWGGGPAKHMRHHRSGDGGFEPFFSWWDGVWDGLNRSRRGGERRVGTASKMLSARS